MGNSFMRGYYAIHDMTDDYLGIAPHSTSNKAFLTTGTIPTQVMDPIGEQSLWTWLIVGAATAGLTFVIAEWLHPWLVSLAWDLAIIVIIEGILTASAITVMGIYLVPFLNTFFEDNPQLNAISPADIGLTVPTVSSSSSAVFAAFGLASFYLKKLMRTVTPLPTKVSKIELL